MRVNLRCLWFLCATAALVACGPDSSTGPGDTRASGAHDASDATASGFDIDVGEWDGESAYLDEDFDEVPDPVDNCPGIFNPDQADRDRDGIGDLCDPHDDDSSRSPDPRES